MFGSVKRIQHFIIHLSHSSIGIESFFPTNQSGVRKLYPQENCPRLGLGFGLGLELGLGAVFLGGNCPTTNQTMHVVVSVTILEQCKFWLQLTFFCCLFLKFKERSPIVPLPLSETFGMTFLTHFSPVFHFYTPWIRQKTKGFLTFSGGIEMEHWAKRVNNAILRSAEDDNMAIAIFLCIELVAISDLISKILYLWCNYFGARLIFLFAV